jgi:ribose 5-phosphate isomerase B
VRVAIGSDHAGFQLKEEIKRFLHNSHVDCGDFGVSSTEPADYPDIAEMVAEAVAQGKFDCGILVCGTGIGMAIAANKVPGIRAALCHDLFTARAAKEHNDANILALGGRVLNPQLACEIVETWLNAHFAGERHARRLEKIRSLEARYCCNGEEKQEVG